MVKQTNKVKPQEGLENNSLFRRADEGGDSPVYVPASDKRKFRYLKLENNLPVILISDPEAQNSAAALSVDVGSRHDPEDFHGLAHFLEHMLFLGSENYPGASEFNSYISAHGGYNNAFTSFEATQYFFQVRPEALAESLERFADMISAPLFNSAYVEKEVKAIHAEYSAKLRFDSRRVDEAEKSLLPAGHPRQKLTVGNHETLPGNDMVEKALLMKALTDFYKTYYSASRMTLSVSSSHSLDELEQYVSGFSNIKNNGSALRKLDLPNVDEQFRKQFDSPPLLVVEKLKPGSTLSLRFELGDLRDYIRNHSVDYVSRILGDEGENSLLIRLKKRDWVKNLRVGFAPRYEGSSELRVDVSLTLAGMEHIAEITEHFFQAVSQIRSELESVDGRELARLRYKEYQRITENAIRFVEPDGAVDAVRGVVNASRYFEPSEIIVGGALYDEFDEQAIRSVLDLLVPSNSLAVLVSDNLPQHFELDKTTRWYGTRHGIFRYADVCAGVSRCEKKLAAIRASEGRVEYAGEDPDLYLPAPNNYLADDFSLRCAEDASAPCLDDSQIEGFDFKILPMRLDYSWGRVFWYTDRFFQQPRVEFAVQLLEHEPDQLTIRDGVIANDMLRAQVLKSLYVRVVREVLRSKGYMASSAGLNYSIHGNRNGLVISLDGYSQTLPRLAEDVFNAFKVGAIIRQINDSAFAAIKHTLAETYNKRLLATPNSRLGGQLSLLLLPDSGSVEQKLKVLQDIDFQDVVSFAEEFLAAYQAEVLLAGNIALSDVETYRKILCTHFNCQQVRQAKLNTEVRDAANIEKLVEAVEVSHSDHASLWYFQAADESIEETASTLLLASVLRAPFFNELRTEQQLGYIVRLSYTPFYNRAGLSLSVQSAKYTGDEIDRAIADWLEKLFSESTTAGSLSEQAFIRHRSSLLKELTSPPKQISEQAGRWWHALQLGDTEFKRRDRLVSAIEKLSYQSFFKFSKHLLSINNSRLVKLQSQPEG